MTLDLKPCPFCGGEASLVSGGPGNHYVRCMTCHVTSNDGIRDSAIEAWNRRSTAPSGQAPLEGVKAHIERFDDFPPDETIGAFGGSGQWVELMTVGELRSALLPASAEPVATAAALRAAIDTFDKDRAALASLPQSSAPDRGEG